MGSYLLMPRDEMRPGDFVRLHEDDAVASPRKVVALTDDRRVVVENQSATIPIDRIKIVIRVLPI